MSEIEIHRRTYGPPSAHERRERADCGLSEMQPGAAPSYEVTVVRDGSGFLGVEGAFVDGAAGRLVVCGHDLELLLVRLLFCLFADDTGIFSPAQAFREWVENRTAPDGSDLGAKLTQFFQVLNTPMEKRQRALDEQLAAFPYVNGRLFEERLSVPEFDSALRAALLNASGLDWRLISPAIFGALFQSIMDPKARRNLGAHYTSEENILKGIATVQQGHERHPLGRVLPLALDLVEELRKRARFGGELAARIQGVIVAIARHHEPRAVAADALERRRELACAPRQCGRPRRRITDVVGVLGKTAVVVDHAGLRMRLHRELGLFPVR